MFRQLVIDFSAIAGGGIAFGSMTVGLVIFVRDQDSRRALEWAGITGLGSGVLALLISLLEGLL